MHICNDIEGKYIHKTILKCFHFFNSIFTVYKQCHPWVALTSDKVSRILLQGGRIKNVLKSLFKFKEVLQPCNENTSYSFSKLYTDSIYEKVSNIKKGSFDTEVKILYLGTHAYDINALNDIFWLFIENIISFEVKEIIEILFELCLEYLNDAYTLHLNILPTRFTFIALKCSEYLKKTDQLYDKLLDILHTDKFLHSNLNIDTSIALAYLIYNLTPIDKAINCTDWLFNNPLSNISSNELLPYLNHENNKKKNVTNNSITPYKGQYEVLLKLFYLLLDVKQKNHEYWHRFSPTCNFPMTKYKYLSDDYEFENGIDPINTNIHAKTNDFANSCEVSYRKNGYYDIFYLYGGRNSNYRICHGIFGFENKNYYLKKDYVLKRINFKPNSIKLNADKTHLIYYSNSNVFVLNIATEEEINFNVHTSGLLKNNDISTLDIISCKWVPNSSSKFLIIAKYGFCMFDFKYDSVTPILEKCTIKHSLMLDMTIMDPLYTMINCKNTDYGINTYVFFASKVFFNNIVLEYYIFTSEDGNKYMMNDYFQISSYKKSVDESSDDESSEDEPSRSYSLYKSIYFCPILKLLFVSGAYCFEKETFMPLQIYKLVWLDPAQDEHCTLFECKELLKYSSDIRHLIDYNTYITNWKSVTASTDYYHDHYNKDANISEGFTKVFGVIYKNSIDDELKEIIIMNIIFENSYDDNPNEIKLKYQSKRFYLSEYDCNLKAICFLDNNTIDDFATKSWIAMLDQVLICGENDMVLKNAKAYINHPHDRKTKKALTYDPKFPYIMQYNTFYTNELMGIANKFGGYSSKFKYTFQNDNVSKTISVDKIMPDIPANSVVVGLEITINPIFDDINDVLVPCLLLHSELLNIKMIITIYCSAIGFCESYHYQSCDHFKNQLTIAIPYVNLMRLNGLEVPYNRSELEFNINYTISVESKKFIDNFHNSYKILNTESPDFHNFTLGTINKPMMFDQEFNTQIKWYAIPLEILDIYMKSDLKYFHTADQVAVEKDISMNHTDLLIQKILSKFSILWTIDRLNYKKIKASRSTQKIRQEYLNLETAVIKTLSPIIIAHNIKWYNFKTNVAITANTVPKTVSILDQIIVNYLKVIFNDEYIYNKSLTYFQNVKVKYSKYLTLNYVINIFISNEKLTNLCNTIDTIDTISYDQVLISLLKDVEYHSNITQMNYLFKYIYHILYNDLEFYLNYLQLYPQQIIKFHQILIYFYKVLTKQGILQWIYYALQSTIDMTTLLSYIFTCYYIHEIIYFKNTTMVDEFKKNMMFIKQKIKLSSSINLDEQMYISMQYKLVSILNYSLEDLIKIIKKYSESITIIPKLYVKIISYYQDLLQRKLNGDDLKKDFYNCKVDSASEHESYKGNFIVNEYNSKPFSSEMITVDNKMCYACFMKIYAPNQNIKGFKLIELKNFDKDTFKYKEFIHMLQQQLDFINKYNKQRTNNAQIKAIKKRAISFAHNYLNEYNQFMLWLLNKDNFSSERLSSIRPGIYSHFNNLYYEEDKEGKRSRYMKTYMSWHWILSGKYYDSYNFINNNLSFYSNSFLEDQSIHLNLNTSIASYLNELPEYYHNEDIDINELKITDNLLILLRNIATLLKFQLCYNTNISNLHNSKLEQVIKVLNLNYDKKLDIFLSKLHLHLSFIIHSYTDINLQSVTPDIYSPTVRNSSTESLIPNIKPRKFQLGSSSKKKDYELWQTNIYFNNERYIYEIYICLLELICTFFINNRVNATIKYENVLHKIAFYSSYTKLFDYFSTTFNFNNHISYTKYTDYYLRDHFDGIDDYENACAKDIDEGNLTEIDQYQQCYNLNTLTKIKMTTNFLNLYTIVFVYFERIFRLLFDPSSPKYIINSDVNIFKYKNTDHVNIIFHSDIKNIIEQDNDLFKLIQFSFQYIKLQFTEFVGHYERCCSLFWGQYLITYANHFAALLKIVDILPMFSEIVIKIITQSTDLLLPTKLIPVINRSDFKIFQHEDHIIEKVEEDEDFREEYFSDKYFNAMLHNDGEAEDFKNHFLYEDEDDELPTCSNDHPLKPFLTYIYRTQREFFNCAICDIQINKPGIKMFSCGNKMCNYNVCYNCYDKLSNKNMDIKIDLISLTSAYLINQAHDKDCTYMFNLKKPFRLKNFDYKSFYKHLDHIIYKYIFHSHLRERNINNMFLDKLLIFIFHLEHTEIQNTLNDHNHSLSLSNIILKYLQTCSWNGQIIHLIKYIMNTNLLSSNELQQYITTYFSIINDSCLSLLTSHANYFHILLTKVCNPSAQNDFKSFLKALAAHKYHSGNHTNRQNYYIDLLPIVSQYMNLSLCAHCYACQKDLRSFSPLNKFIKERKYTYNSHIYKLTEALDINRLTIHLENINENIAIEQIQVYGTNQEISDLQNLSNIHWKYFGYFEQLFMPITNVNPNTVKLDLFIKPISTLTSLKILFIIKKDETQILKNLICPRCDISHYSQVGICMSCNENIFQCTRCRNINYDNLYASICNECGHSKYFDMKFTMEYSTTSIKLSAISNSIQRDQALHLLLDNYSSLHKKYDTIQSIKHHIYQYLHQIDLNYHANTIHHHHQAYQKIMSKIPLLSIYNHWNNINYIQQQLAQYNIQDNLGINQQISSSLAIFNQDTNCIHCSFYKLLNVIQLICQINQSTHHHQFKLNHVTTLKKINFQLLIENFSLIINKYQAFFDFNNTKYMYFHTIIKIYIFSIDSQHRFISSLNILKNNHISYQIQLLIVNYIHQVIQQQYHQLIKEDDYFYLINQFTNLIFNNDQLNSSNDLIKSIKQLLIKIIIYLIQNHRKSKPNWIKAQDHNQNVLLQNYINNISIKNNDLFSPLISSRFISNEEQKKKNQMDHFQLDEQINMRSSCNFITFLDSIPLYFMISLDYTLLSNKSIKNIAKLWYYKVKRKKKLWTNYQFNDKSLNNLYQLLLIYNQQPSSYFYLILNQIMSIDNNLSIEYYQFILNIIQYTSIISYYFYLKKFYHQLLSYLCQLIDQIYQLELNNILHDPKLKLYEQIIQILIQILLIFHTNDLIFHQLQQSIDKSSLYYLLQSFIYLRCLITLRTTMLNNNAKLIFQLIQSLCNYDEYQLMLAYRSIYNNHSLIANNRIHIFLLHQFKILIKPTIKKRQIYIHLQKSYTQNDYIRGEMNNNPYTLADFDGLNMLHIKNKICHTLNLPDAINMFELIVANKIINQNLKIIDVYDQIWLPYINSDEYKANNNSSSSSDMADRLIFQILNHTIHDNQSAQQLPISMIY